MDALSTVNMVFGLLQKLLFPSKLIIWVIQSVRTRVWIATISNFHGHVWSWYVLDVKYYNFGIQFGNVSDSFNAEKQSKRRKYSIVFIMNVNAFLVKRKTPLLWAGFFGLISKEDVLAGWRRRETTLLLYMTFIFIPIFISVYYASRLFIV